MYCIYVIVCTVPNVPYSPTVARESSLRTVLYHIYFIRTGYIHSVHKEGIAYQYLMIIGVYICI
jgi:hypothetical protein